MDKYADLLFMESAGKNFIDQDEYPSSNEIHDRVINMPARLYHAPLNQQPVGTGAIVHQKPYYSDFLPINGIGRRTENQKANPQLNPT